MSNPDTENNDKGMAEALKLAFDMAMSTIIDLTPYEVACTYDNPELGLNLPWSVLGFFRDEKDALAFITYKEYMDKKEGNRHVKYALEKREWEMPGKPKEAEEPETPEEPD